MRALGVFWLLVAAALGGGALLLHRAGPPEGGVPPSLAPAPGRVAAMPDGTPLAPPPPPWPTPLAAAEPPAPPVSAPPAVPEAPASPAAVASPAAPAPVAQAGAPPTPAAVLPDPAPVPSPPGPAATASLPSAPEPPPLAREDERAAPAPSRPIPPPDATLQEPSRHGPVPRLGEGGRTAIRHYGRAVDRGESRPRIALVVGNLGLSASLSEEAIRRLPPEVALAFSPYGARPAALLDQARARGMELLSALPLEPANYPANDPGERALLTTLSPAENDDRLLWVLSRIGGQVGAIGALGPMRGERFAALPGLLNDLQDNLRDRGLLYLDPRPGGPAPARAWGRAVDLVVDEPATRSEIDRRLGELERLARERGTALGLAQDVTPVLVDRIAAWAAGLEGKGLVLSPVTALIRRPADLPRNRE